MHVLYFVLLSCTLGRLEPTARRVLIILDSVRVVQVALTARLVIEGLHYDRRVLDGGDLGHITHLRPELSRYDVLAAAPSISGRLLFGD